MAERYISLPKPLSSGDVEDWFKRFDICTRANGWDAEVKAKKLLTLLEGEALAVWLDFTSEQQDDYVVTKKEMEKVMLPMNFVSLDDFHCKKISLYVHDLRKLLSHALPGTDQNALEPLLLYQFLAGIPNTISRQLRASGEVSTLEKVMTRAILLMSIESDSVAAVMDKQDSCVEKSSETQLLKEQIAALTEQVAVFTAKALSEQVAILTTRANRPPRSRPRCFNCGQVGHLQCDCCRQRCFYGGKLGHLSKDCWYQLHNGMPVRGNKRP